jgi:hypothetical protein
MVCTPEARPCRNVKYYLILYKLVSMSAFEIKEKIQKRLAEINDETVLEDIYQMVCEDQEPYLLSTEQKARIDLAKKEIKEGKVISNEEATRQAKEWLKK